MPAKPKPAPAAAPTLQPIGTPPAGGRWTWDAATATWVPLPDHAAAPAAPAPQSPAQE